MEPFHFGGHLIVLDLLALGHFVLVVDVEVVFFSDGLLLIDETSLPLPRPSAPC